MRTRIAIPLVLALVGLACQPQRKPAARPANTMPATPARDELERSRVAANRAGLTGSAITSAPSPTELAQGAIDLPGSLETGETPAMIIRSGSASLKIDSLEPALASLRVLAGRVGGYVANTSVQA